MIIENVKSDVICSKEEINRITKELGDRITKDYSGKNLLVVSVLKGCFFFSADLLREIKLPLKIDFMISSSYGNSKNTSGRVVIKKDIDYDLTNIDVLVVDDILDTGITMDFLINHLKRKNPNSVKLCVLFNKEARRKVNIKADYIGMEVEDKFLVGYGMDYGEKYRNLPEVYYIKEDHE